MKVIAFNGSPNKNGNTSILIDTVLAEISAQGIETEVVHLGAKQLHGCIACGKCAEGKDKKCVIKNDELNLWIDKMCNADGIIIGSPVYCADLNAQTKAFIDRASFVACMNDDIFKRKAGASVIAVRRAGALHAFHSINSFFTISQMIIVGSTYWNTGFGMLPGEVKQDGEGLQTMRNLGLNMAWLLKSIEASKNTVSQPQTNRAVMTNFIR